MFAYEAANPEYLCLIASVVVGWRTTELSAFKTESSLPRRRKNPALLVDPIQR